MLGFTGTELFPMVFPDMLGENYDKRTIEEMKQNPRKWLQTLPMTEYIHVLLTMAWQQFGGEPVQYHEILFRMFLLPILNRYHDDLELYRFCRAIKKNKYDSHRELYKKIDGFVNLRCRMGHCTAKTRKLIRQVCMDYRYLQGLGKTNTLVVAYKNALKNLLEAEEISNDMSSLEAIIAQAQVGDE